MASIQNELQSLFQTVNRLETEYKKYNRKFTIDGHLIGSIGEVIVADAFDLELAPTGNALYDAWTKTKPKKTVQIKTTQIDRVSFSKITDTDDAPDYIIVIQIDKTGEWQLAFNGPGKLVYENIGKPQKNGQSQISVNKLRNLIEKAKKSEQIPLK